MWAAQWSKAIRERLTGAPICQLNQIAALSASRRWTTRAHSPAGTRPPWRSRPSWFFRVQMMASTRWRSQFGKYRGSFLVFAGRADQGQAQVRAGEERFGVLAGQALVRDDGGARRGPVRGLALQHRAGLLAFAGQFRVGQAEPGHGPVAGARSAAAWHPSTSGNGCGQYP